MLFKSSVPENGGKKLVNHFPFHLKEKKKNHSLDIGISYIQRTRYFQKIRYSQSKDAKYVSQGDLRDHI